MLGGACRVMLVLRDAVSPSALRNVTVTLIAAVPLVLPRTVRLVLLREMRLALVAVMVAVIPVGGEFHDTHVSRALLVPVRHTPVLPWLSVGVGGAGGLTLTLPEALL